jgi:hypothetical protein
VRILPLIIAVTLPVIPALAAEPDAEDHFRERVWPVLDRACVKCHGSEKQKGELRLDSLEAALKGGENGAAVVPGKPDDSLLLKLIRHELPDGDRMPPKEKLHAGEIADIRKWIADGAAWPAAATNPASAEITPGERIGDAWSDPRNPIVRIFGGRRLDLWSLKPLRSENPPEVEQRDWVQNPIDQFVLAKIEDAEKRPSPEADRRVLIRRVTFDLIGLPPTPEEVSAFVNDQEPNAYDHLVDRLLSSPRYGEHWARMWLDVARYSDSNGFDWDEYRPQAWRFRDYVVRSLNADKPFDQFIREQLAGDESVPGEPQTAAEQDSLIATGFLRLGPQDNSAAQFGEAGKVRQQLMADLVETTSSALLGMTMACARCHDHKYDPISHADHYRLQAFFEGVKGKDDLPLDLAPEQDAIRKHNAEIEQQIAPKKAAIEALLEPVRKRLAEPKLAKLTEEERALLKTPKGERKGDLKQRIKKLEEQIAVSDDEIKGGLDEKDAAAQKALKGEIAALEEKRRSFTTALIMLDEGAPGETRILEGGNIATPKAAVVPGFLSALDPNPATVGKVPREKSSGRRTALANWIVSAQNPLTGRVLVNRIWQSYFGEGIVATPNDFGLAGARPTHPELLDWLANAFMRRETDDATTRPALAWSLKKLHRLIVTSATYRQSSTISSGEPPGSNHLLTRQNPRRLTAEALRDAMLATSGKLIETAGGPPVWPELPQEVLVANPAFLDDNKEKTKGWYPSPAEKMGVRSLFIIQKRTVRVPMMEVFDLPDNSVTCARRTVSTVAPQALTLLNSPFAVQTAESFAERVAREAGDSPALQVERAFALAVQRAPDERERTACLKFRDLHSLPELCRVVLNLNEFVYLD